MPCYIRQAHWNAQQHTDEFVMDLLVSLDKVSLLVQELLVMEVRPAAHEPCRSCHSSTSAVVAATYQVTWLHCEQLLPVTSCDSRTIAAKGPTQ